MAIERDRIRSRQGMSGFETRAKKHMETDWGNVEKFPRLRQLGCVDPEPFVDDDPFVEPGGQLMIRCRKSGNVFSPSEAGFNHGATDWIPSPEEIEERRNAIRDAWTPAETDAHDVSLSSTEKERRSEKAYTVPQVGFGISWMRGSANHQRSDQSYHGGEGSGQ